MKSQEERRGCCRGSSNAGRSRCKSGRGALAALDAGGIQCVVALLSAFLEYGDWRLVLASPSLDQTHPLMAQDKVAEVWAGRFAYRLPIVMTLLVRDPFNKVLRQIFSKTADVEAMRFGGQMIGNRFVETLMSNRIK